MRVPLSNRLKNRQFVLYDSRKLDIVDQETARFPLPVRRALAEKLLLRQAPICILEGERLAGLRPVMSMPNYALEEKKELAWNVARLTPDICYGHNSPNYWMVLEKGLNGLVAEIDGYQKTEMDDEKRIYREAMKIAAQAIIEYAARNAGRSLKSWPTYAGMSPPTCQEAFTRRFRAYGLHSPCSGLPGTP